MADGIKERKRRALEAEYVIDPPFPREIFIDLTSFCNHACVFCSNPRLKVRGTMNGRMVRRVLKEAHENGALDAGLYATGEPLLINNLHDYVKEAKRIGYEYVFITTNGALAVPERVRPVLDAGLDSIKFSISAGTRESYKRIHGKDDFVRVMENLRWVAGYRKRAGLGCRIYVTMVYTDATAGETEMLKEQVMPYADEWDPHLLTNQCGNKSDNNHLGRIEKNNIRGRVNSRICFQPFKGLAVTPEGYVSACVLDYQRYLILGNLNNSTLKEIWSSGAYRAFRQRHIDGGLEGLICHNCINNTDQPAHPVSPEYAVPFGP